MTLFNLMARVLLDTKDYEKGINEAKNKSSGLGNALKTAGKIGGIALGAITTAASAATGAMTKAVSATAEYGDNIDKSSQKLGMSAQAFQEWDAILQHTGGSIESIKPAMKTLAKEAVDNSKAFQELGISQEEVQNLSKEDIFEKTITALQQMPEGMTRTRLAAQLLGRSSIELGALLNTSAEDTEAMRKRVHELGGVMSDEAVKASATFQDNMQDLKTAFSGISRQLAGEFMPGINNVIAGFTSLVIGEEGAEEALSAGFSSILTSIGNLSSRIGEVVGKILPVIISQLPTILKAGIEIVTALGKAIIDNVDLLIDAAFEIINMLVSSLSENLPDLMVAAVSILESIATSIIENLPMLLNSALNIIMALAEGIVAALPQLIAMLPQLISSIIEFIISALPQIVHTGAELIIALVHGLIDARDELLPAILEIITSLATGLMDLQMEILEVGLDLILTLAEGLMSEESLNKMLESAANLINELLSGIGNHFRQVISKGSELVGKFISGISSTWDRLRNIGATIIDWVYNGISNAIDSAVTWGRDLIDNFIGGITQKWRDLKDSVSNVADTVKGFLGFSEPEEGPLSNFHTYAPDMMKLFAQGIRDNEGLVRGELERAFDFQNIIQGGFGEVTYSATGGSPFGTMVELLNRYLPQLANLKVVMDSGTVVGELRDKMNQSLGEVGRYDKRGLATT